MIRRNPPRYLGSYNFWKRHSPEILGPVEEPELLSEIFGWMADAVEALDLEAPPGGFLGLKPRVELGRDRFEEGRNQLANVFEELHKSNWKTRLVPWARR